MFTTGSVVAFEDCAFSSSDQAVALGLSQTTASLAYCTATGADAWGRLWLDPGAAVVFDVGPVGASGQRSFSVPLPPSLPPGAGVMFQVAAIVAVGIVVSTPSSLLLP